MMELDIANFMMFFIVIGSGLVFVIIWIIKSEARVNAAKINITKLGTDIAKYEREKHALLEKVSALENARTAFPAKSGGHLSTADSLLSDDLRARNDILSEENSRLKRELEEAKGSLEEVYKALSSQE